MAPPRRPGVGHRLEAAERIRLDDDALFGGVDGDIREFGLDFVDDRVEVAVADDSNRRAGHRVREFGRGDLDPGRGRHLVDLFEPALGPDFRERPRLEQRADVGDDRFVLPADDDPIVRPDRPVVQYRIDRRPEPFLLFDLENGADAGAGDVDLHLLFHVALGEPHHDGQEVRDPLAGHRRDGDDADVALEVLDPPVEVRGEPLVGEVTDDLVEALVEPFADAIGLGLVGVVDRRILVRVPTRHGVDLVRRDDERGFRPPQDVQGLERLGLEAVVDVDDEDGDVGQRSPAGAQRGKGVMARGVDEEEAGEVEVVRVDEFARDRGDDVQRNGGRADVLGDRACFALDDCGAADLIEETCLAVIDVSEDGDDRRSERCGVACIRVRHDEPPEKVLPKTSVAP